MAVANPTLAGLQPAAERAASFRLPGRSRSRRPEVEVLEPSRHVSNSPPVSPRERMPRLEERAGPRLAPPDAPPLRVASGAAAQEPDVEELLPRAIQGCPETWSRIYRLYFPRIYRRVKLLVGATTLAEELTQECFVQAMLHISRFRREGKFSSWLYAIAHNLVRNHWRRRQSSENVKEGLGQIEQLRPSPSQDQRVLAQQRIAAIYAALEELPESLRVVFVFRYFEGMRSAEIAQELNLTVNNVDARASRARRRIKALLEERGWFGADFAAL